MLSLEELVARVTEYEVVHADLISLKAPTGAGKTECLKKLEAMATGDETIPVVAITNSISSTTKLAAMFGVSNWSAPAGSLEREAAQRSGMACCVESLLASDRTSTVIDILDKYRDVRAGYVHVVLDEAVSVMAYLAMGGTDRVIEGRSHIVYAVRDLVRLPWVRVFMSDAHLSDLEVDKMRAWLGQPVELSLVSAKTRDDAREVAVSFGPQLNCKNRQGRYLRELQHLVKYAEDGAPVWLMAGTPDTLLWAAEELLPCLNPDRRLLITSDTRKTDSRVRKFLANPDVEAAKYDQIYSSPCITTNVSVVSRSYHVCVLQEGYWKATDVVQALNRNRTALSRTLLALNKHRNSSATPEYKSHERLMLNGFVEFTEKLVARELEESRHNENVIRSLLGEEGFTIAVSAESEAANDFEAVRENQCRLRAYLRTFAITTEEAAEQLGICLLAECSGDVIRSDHCAFRRFFEGVRDADDAVLKKIGLDPRKDRPRKHQRRDMRWIQPRLRKIGFELTRIRQANSSTYYHVQQVFSVTG